MPTVTTPSTFILYYTSLNWRMVMLPKLKLFGPSPVYALWFFSSTFTWVPGVKLRSPGLYSQHLDLQSHLIRPSFISIYLQTFLAPTKEDSSSFFMPACRATARGASGKHINMNTCRRLESGWDTDLWSNANSKGRLLQVGWAVCVRCCRKRRGSI